jgi:hypothetical protein
LPICKRTLRSAIKFLRSTAHLAADIASALRYSCAISIERIENSIVPLAVRTSAPSSLTLSEPHARLGVIEEFDSEGLQCKLHFADGHCAAGDRLGAPCFHVSDRVHVDPSRVRHLLLIDPRQSARGLQLISSGEHGLVSIPILGLT